MYVPELSECSRWRTFHWQSQRNSALLSSPRRANSFRARKWSLAHDNRSRSARMTSSTLFPWTSVTSTKMSWLTATGITSPSPQIRLENLRGVLCDSCSDFTRHSFFSMLFFASVFSLQKKNGHLLSTFLFFKSMFLHICQEWQFDAELIFFDAIWFTHVVLKIKYWHFHMVLNCGVHYQIQEFPFVHVSKSL